MAKRKSPEINASSMADIAFLLLVFFLITTTFQADEGIPMVLPPERTEDQPPVDLNDRNVLPVLLNKNDELLVEETEFKLKEVKETVYKFITGNPPLPGEEPPDSPQDAVVSLKADRGTSYEVFIQVLDQIKAGYHQARADYLGISLQEYLDLDPKNNPADAEKLERAQNAFPLQISEAEPTDIGG